MPARAPAPPQGNGAVHRPPAPGTDPGARSLQLTLVSWNVHGSPLARDVGARLARIADKILELAPDIVVLQEVWSDRQVDLLRRRLGPRYQFLTPPEELNGWVFRAGGLLTLVGRSHEVEGSGFQAFTIEGSAWRFWEGDAYGDKGVLQVDVMAAGGVPLSILNTHLQSEYGERRHADIRRAQLRQLRRVAEAMGPRRLVLAAGDLNTLADEPIFGEVAAHWSDLTGPARNQCRCGTRLLSDGREEGWVDHVLSRPLRSSTVEVLEVGRVRNVAPDRPYSDHCAVLIRLRLLEGPAARLLSRAP